MVNVAQLVRASDCGSEGRGFEPHLSPQNGEPKRLSFHFGVKEILNYAAKAAFRFAARRSVLGGGKSLLQSNLKDNQYQLKTLLIGILLQWLQIKIH